MRYASNFKVSNAFSSHMILQRGEFIRVWGWSVESNEGCKIDGVLDGVRATTTVHDGEWELNFTNKWNASTAPTTLEVSTDSQKVVFDDVLFGDVYIISGQSNTKYDLSYLLENVPGCFDLDAFDQNSQIRLNINSMHVHEGYPKDKTELVRDVLCNKGWTTCARESVLEFSAIGFLTANKIYLKHNKTVPIGVIEIHGDGCNLGAFLPNEVAEKTKADFYDEKLGMYITNGLNYESGTRYVYNHYTHPWARYAIAGFIWYQGESNCNKDASERYPEQFAALFEYARGTHNLVNPCFPLYVIELAPCYEDCKKFPNPAFIPYDIIRPVMGGMIRNIPNAYFVPTSDTWHNRTYWNNIHPYNKAEVAGRLADAIWTVQAGGALDGVLGPIPSSAKFADDRMSVVITFDRVGRGLATCDGAPVRGFKALVGPLDFADDDFVVSADIISKNQVKVVTRAPMTGIAYNAYTGNEFGTEINLTNDSNVPAGAFTL